MRVPDVIFGRGFVAAAGGAQRAGAIVAAAEFLRKENEIFHGIILKSLVGEMLHSNRLTR